MRPEIERNSDDADVALLSSNALEACDAYVTEVPLPGLSGAGYGEAVCVRPSPEHVEKWRSIIRGDDSQALQIGLVWRGGEAHPANDLRSIPIELLTPMLSIKEVRFGPEAVRRMS